MNDTTELHIEARDRYNWAVVETGIVEDENSSNFGERVIRHTKYFNSLDYAARHAVDLGLRIGGLDKLIEQRDYILEQLGLK